MTWPADEQDAPACLLCGEPERVEIAEVWSSHELMNGTCCEGLHETVVGEMADDPAWARQLLRQAGIEELTGHRLRRLADDGGCSLVLDYQLEQHPVTFPVARAFVGRYHQHGIVAAPAYRLGWSRLSCIACIFGNADQWASLQHIAPAWFERIAAYEDKFDRTMHRRLTVRERAKRGRLYEAALRQPGLARAALATDWTESVRASPHAWQLPAGAFGSSLGPS